jgi:uroporphyrinogen decarboxylase
MDISKSNFIKACYGRNDGTIPVWIMRQAGRYLPEYMRVRAKVSFQELCHSPELITEVVHQPIDRFGLDAAILFSDILTILEPMGIKVDFPDGGPVLDKPITTPDDIKRLKDFNVEEKLHFVLDGIRKIKERLPDVPLIGFVGSPFTLACYLIEGRGSRNFDSCKKFIHTYPDAADELFDFLTGILARYLEAQIDAGADVVQVFESWGGVLSHDDFRRHSVAPVSRIFSDLKSKNVPRIYFVNNVAPYLDLLNDVPCEVIGVDYRTELSYVESRLSSKALQGNLDPTILFGTPESVSEKTRQILGSVKDHRRLIFNLGHGILPGTPLESVTALVETVHKYRS